jgi:predicted ATP-dependent endonuclease of OLD family
MYIKEVNLSNVRQFKNSTFIFQSGFNLLVGENGVGKSTVLRSLLATVGSKTHLGGGNLGLEPSDIRLEANRLHVHTVLIDDEQLHRAVRYSRGIREGVSRSGKKSDVIVLFYRSNEALTRNLKTKKARRTQLQMPSESGAVEDFLYTTEFETNLEIKREERFGRSREIRGFVTEMLSKMSNRFGGFDWRFEAYECVLKEVGEDKEESNEQRTTDGERAMQKEIAQLLLRSFQSNPTILGDVDQRNITINSDGYVVGSENVSRVAPPFFDLLEKSTENTRWYDRAGQSYVAEIKLTPRIVVELEGRQLPLSQLSDGEQRLFSLFVDIARVLTLSSSQSIRGAAAIVLIDEIDVHLHPKWQRDIVPLLENFFPSCQFIATTHSPFVIQSLDRDRVVKITEQGSLKFGAEAVSIEDIVEEIQGVNLPQQSRRAKELGAAAERYFTLLREENVDPSELQAAEKNYRVASKPFASNPALNALLRIEKLQAGKK